MTTAQQIPAETPIIVKGLVDQYATIVGYDAQRGYLVSYEDRPGFPEFAKAKDIEIVA